MDKATQKVMEDAVGALGRLASAVTPSGVVTGHDAAGGAVASLTEAVMGITAGLVRVADGLESIAAAIRERPHD